MIPLVISAVVVYILIFCQAAGLWDCCWRQENEITRGGGSEDSEIPAAPGTATKNITQGESGVCACVYVCVCVRGSALGLIFTLNIDIFFKYKYKQKSLRSNMKLI